MKIGIKEYASVLNSFGMLKFPRKVGNPYQSDVFDAAGLLNWIRDNTGRKICFTSHLYYPKIDRFFNPITACVDKLFVDLDSDRKIENALKEARILINWLDEECLPHNVVFSGKKGFHIYMYFKPANFKFDESLWRIYRAVHTYIKHTLKLNTVDRKCKNPNRLCRIPYTRYVNMPKKEAKYTVHDTYCSPLTNDQLFNYGVREVIAYAREPTISVSHKPEPVMTIMEWIDQLRGKQSLKSWVKEWEYKDEVNIKTGKVEYSEIAKIRKNAFHEMLKNLLVRPCIWNELFTFNPSHEARRMAVVGLMRAGYKTNQKDFDEIVRMLDILSVKSGWADKDYRGRRIYQIYSIFTASPPYKMDKCSNIKTYRSSTTGKSLCVGKACPKFMEGL